MRKFSEWLEAVEDFLNPAHKKFMELGITFGQSRSGGVINVPIELKGKVDEKWLMSNAAELVKGDIPIRINYVTTQDLQPTLKTGGFPK